MNSRTKILIFLLCLVLGLDLAQGAVVCFDAQGHLAIELGHCSDASAGLGDPEGDACGADSSCSKEDQTACVNVTISDEGLNRRAFDDLPVIEPLAVAGHLPVDPAFVLTPAAARARTEIPGGPTPFALLGLRSTVLLI